MSDTIFEPRNERAFDENKQVAKAARLWLTDGPPVELQVAGENFTTKSTLPKRTQAEDMKNQSKRSINTTMLDK